MERPSLGLGDRGSESPLQYGLVLPLGSLLRIGQENFCCSRQCFQIAQVDSVSISDCLSTMAPRKPSLDGAGELIGLTDLTLANIVCQNITEVAINTDDFETQFWHFFILSVASLVMVVGTLGNLLTLAAIPYMRSRYPAEFSLLQLPVTDLLINLSVCDLVYCGLGLPHMIHGMVVGDQCDNVLVYKN